MLTQRLVFIANNVILSEVERSKAAFNKDTSLTLCINSFGVNCYFITLIFRQKNIRTEEPF